MTEVDKCPACGDPRVAGERFCEHCGYDFVESVAPQARIAVAPTPAACWQILIAADRSYYDRVTPAGVSFPSSYSPRTFLLNGKEARVGRRSTGSTSQVEIDLSGAPEDPGISRLHGMFAPSADGCYAFIDLDSTNGTTVNDEEATLSPRIPRALKDGDQIHLGAWTTITIRSGSPAISS